MWKGKDWFSILAPKSFGNAPLAETPATDSKSVMGRVIEISVPELTGDQSKYWMKLCFKINKINGKNAYTKFYGYKCIKQYIFRMVRKRIQKMRAINNLETKDGWKLQVSNVTILNRKTNIMIEKKVRKFVFEFLKDKAKELTHDEFVKQIINSEIQTKIKKLASKIYPVRFCEIEKVEVVASPN